jgi:hypothetical protein
MAVPQVGLLPDPPLTTDSEEVFNAKADTTLLAQQAMVPQINIALTWTAAQVLAVQGYASAAFDSAAAAAQSASGTGADAAAAHASAVSAAASAAAAGAAAGLPAMAGRAGYALVVNDDEQGVSFVNLAPKRWAAVLSM